MSAQILVVLIILAAVIVLLVTEWVALEVLALLVLGVLAVSSIVSPTEALAGFSNPAVITIWAVFILSGGLTRTGIANILGRRLLTVAGKSVGTLVVVIMLLSGVLSAFMNNVAIAALMLPVVMDIARKTGHAPSTLLMPLAYGSLLGGLTTMIGTPPNILVSEALRNNGLVPFKLFDFTPVGLVVMICGIAFVTLIGIRMLPKRSVARETSDAYPDYRAQYELQERLFSIRIPHDSALVGKTLAKSRLGAGLGLNVVAVTRGRQTLLAPDITEVIQPNDELIVEGRQDRIQEMNHWGQLLTETDVVDAHVLFSYGMQVAAVRISETSEYVNQTLFGIGFRNRYGLNVLEVRKGAQRVDEDLKGVSLQPKDLLMVHGPVGRIEALGADANFDAPQFLDAAELKHGKVPKERLRALRVPAESKLVGLTLSRSRLGDALDVQILCIVRKQGSALVPASEDQFEAGDLIIVSGASDMV
ncbi:MAG: SLC13 family permease, partial [Desulfobacteraceae bacterium]